MSVNSDISRSDLAGSFGWSGIDVLRNKVGSFRNKGVVSYGISIMYSQKTRG